MTEWAGRRAAAAVAGRAASAAASATALVRKPSMADASTPQPSRNPSALP
ncbi:hypothetical protein [Streptomyces sp. NPDC088256]